VGRPGLAGRTRSTLLRLTRGLDEPALRVMVLGGGLVVSLLLHAATADPNVAWLSAPLVLLAGLAAGPRTLAAVLAAAIGGHTAIDVANGVDGTQVVGLVARPVVLVGVGLVGTATAHLERQRGRAMERAVSEDPVTGLLSVRAFYDRLARLQDDATRYTVILADIRGMRALNDRYGHPTGTEAMRALAQVLRRAAGPEVLASRLGSDEVAVALLEADQDRCQQVVAQVIARLHDEQVPLPDGERFEVHAAYGVARFPEDGSDTIAVLRAAERAKQLAKREGMDQVVTADGRVL
jgi:diguanylate cyclase (GGDEF)-like protein